MPIKISKDLPAYKTLIDENIFVMPLEKPKENKRINDLTLMRL